MAIAACVPAPVHAPTDGGAGSTIAITTGEAGTSGGAGDPGAAGDTGGPGGGAGTAAPTGLAGDGGGATAGVSGGAGDQGGAGQAGASGQAGAGQAGTSGQAGAGADGGAAGAPPPPLDPCLRTSWTFTPSVLCTTACAGMADAQKLPINAIDGNTSTRWTTGLAQGSKGPESVVLSFPSSATLSGITLYAKSATDFPIAYLVEYATDGLTFQGFTPSVAGAGTTQLAVTFPQPASMRALRITQTGKGAHWWSINELTVTGCTSP